MLVKFDHITFVVNRAQLDNAVAEFERQGYKLALHSDHVDNLESKKEFLSFKDKDHALYFMQAPEGRGLSVELIAYEHTTCNAPALGYSLGENRLVMNAPDTDELSRMLLAMGCRAGDGGEVVFSGVLDTEEYAIVPQVSSQTAFNLDNEGFCCPTFFVRPASKTANALKEAGFRVTDPEFLKVEDKTMYVMFALGSRGELIEIVSNKI